MAAMPEKCALVTGASSGIGAAIARRLARDGYRVTAAGRDAARTQALASGSDRIRAWVGALAASDDCDRLVADCAAESGGIDVLVNNAGIYVPATAGETTDQIWHETLSINLSVPFYLCRAALPWLRSRKGVIVNIASNWGIGAGPHAVAYCASKGGLVLLTKALAVDHAAEGIRVNAICPGDVDTPMLFRDASARGLDREAVLRESAASTRSGRVTTPEEVAGLVAYLASPEAAQVNGEAILMDGGSMAGAGA
jgi:meso-butanediol dehydrogenase / (S,S)-butanediol dehydrogenase / diacetyl reductase